MIKHVISKICRLRNIAVIVLMLFTGIKSVSGFAVLSHEAIIDASWDKAITSLLLKKFPNTKPEELIKAHAFAYGGAITPDMGYFPFGSTLFTNLLHYVRSGDFVSNLLSEAKDVNEFAFALGSLAHYTADRDGHPGAVNLSVGMVYPKEKQQFGDVIYYAEDPITHRRIEFGFDVLQVARGKYSPKEYHDFIGFEVAQSLLERAFVKTYGLELKEICSDLPLCINTFRWSVKSLLPELTRAAWVSKKNEIRKMQPEIKRREFYFGLSRQAYREEWGENYHRPKIGDYFVAAMVALLPKVGIIRILKFKCPTAASEELFFKSFDKIVEDYSAFLEKYETHKLHLDNIDFDTGNKTAPCEYLLADETYKQLLLKLSISNSEKPDNALRVHLLQYYKSTPPNIKNNAEQQKYEDAMNWVKSGL